PPRRNREDQAFDTKLLIALQDRFIRRGTENRDWHLFRLAPRLVSTLVEIGDRRREVLYLHSSRNPPVTVSHHAMEALRRQRSQYDGRVWFLPGFRVAPDRIEVNKLPVIFGSIFGP